MNARFNNDQMLILESNILKYILILRNINNYMRL